MHRLSSAWQTSLKRVWIFDSPRLTFPRYIAHTEHLLTRLDAVVKTPAQQFRFSKRQSQKVLNHQGRTQNPWSKGVKNWHKGISKAMICRNQIRTMIMVLEKERRRELERYFRICLELKWGSTQWSCLLKNWKRKSSIWGRCITCNGFSKQQTHQSE